MDLETINTQNSSNFENSKTPYVNNKLNQNYYLIKLHGSNPNSSLCSAKVSLNKIDYVDKYKWYLGKNGYPYTYIEGSRIPLHRYIWYINKGVWSNTCIDNKTKQIKKLYVDHANRDKLDATDENLRLSTPAENSYNKTSNSNILDPHTEKPLHHIKFKKSGYVVSIRKQTNTHKIDKIPSLEEAKNIYNMMATELFGEFAVLYEI